MWNLRRPGMRLAVRSTRQGDWVLTSQILIQPLLYKDLGKVTKNNSNVDGSTNHGNQAKVSETDPAEIKSNLCENKQLSQAGESTDPLEVPKSAMAHGLRSNIYNPEIIWPVKEETPTVENCNVTPIYTITNGNQSTRSRQPIVLSEDCPFALLGVHLDGLEFGLNIPWMKWKDLHSALVSLSQQAAHTKDKCIAARLTGRDVLVWRSSKRIGYPLHIQTQFAHIYIAAHEKIKYRSNVCVSLDSRALFTHSLGYVLLQVELFLRGLSAMSDSSRRKTLCCAQWKHSLQRLDLAVDVQLHQSLTLEQLDAEAVTHLEADKLYRKSKRLESIYYGDNDLILRIYDKSQEVKVHAKEWIWDYYEMEPASNLWRFEFQLRNTQLRGKYGIKDLEFLVDVMPPLLKDLATTSFRLKVPGGSNTTRREFTPLWQAIVDAADLLTKPGAKVTRPRKETKPPNPDWYPRHIQKYLVGFAAASGVVDRQEAAQAFAEKIAACFDDDSWMQQLRVKCFHSGLPLPEETPAVQGQDGDGPKKAA